MRAWRSSIARRSVRLSRRSRMIARASAGVGQARLEDRPEGALDGDERRLRGGRAARAARTSSASASDVPTTTSSFDEK